MSRFTKVDLTKLPAADAIEALSKETILSEVVADMTNRMASRGIPYDVGAMETDPFKILAEVFTERETNLRARVNDSVKAVLLAYSWGTNLDHIGARLGVERQDGEADDRLRDRIQLAIEAFSTAGPNGAYVFHGYSASPLVKDLAVYGPESEIVEPGEVGVYVLSTEGNGAASEELLALVETKLNEDDVRPLTDYPLINSAEIVPYQIALTIKVPRGPDAEAIRTFVQQRITEYVTSRHAIGRSVSLAGIIAAAFVQGAVEDVDVASPSDDIETTPTQAAYCTAAEVFVEVLET